MVEVLDTVLMKGVQSVCSPSNNLVATLCIKQLPIIFCEVCDILLISKAFWITFKMFTVIS